MPNFPILLMLSDNRTLIIAKEVDDVPTGKEFKVIASSLDTPHAIGNAILSLME